MRTVIIGAGAVGGVIAAVLKKKGYDIELVARHPDLAMKIKQEGIHAYGHCGDIKVTIPTMASVNDLDGKYDLALLAVKGYDLPGAAKDLLPYLKEGSRVVSLQNGICEEALAEIVGVERTVGCSVGWGATMHGPGEVEMTSGGEFVIGNWKRGKDDKLEKIANILSNVVGVRITDEVESGLYSKLIINSCITTLGVITGLYLGEMLAMRKARDVFIQIIREAMDVANAMKLDVDPYAQKLNYYKFLRKGFLSGFKRHVTIRVIGHKYRKLKSSSLQSVERGKRTEVDNYNGYIAGKGKELGVQTPVNVQLTKMVKEIEKGERNISQANLGEIKLST